MYIDITAAKTGSKFIALGIPFSTETELMGVRRDRERTICAIESDGGGGEPYL